jgi:hypothetical protein
MYSDQRHIKLNSNAKAKAKMRGRQRQRQRGRGNLDCRHEEGGGGDVPPMGRDREVSDGGHHGALHFHCTWRRRLRARRRTRNGGRCPEDGEPHAITLLVAIDPTSAYTAKE